MTITDTLAELVAIPSPSGNEEAMADFLASWIHERTALQPERIGNNLLVHIQGKDATRCVIFNGHIDTVTVGEPDAWHTDPYTLSERQDELVGLGVSDMKGAVATMLHLLLDYQASAPACDIYMMFVVEEETTGKGTKDVSAHIKREQLLANYDKTAGIVGESTELGVRLGHRGNVFAEVIFHGKGSHGATPGAPETQAILKATAFVNSIENKINEWSVRFNDELLGNPSATVTKFIAGLDGSVNQVPGECRVILDIRTAPALHAQLEAELTEWAHQYDAIVSIISQSPAGFCAPSAPIAQIAMRLADQESPLVTQGSTDQCFMSAAGIPTIICGPGIRSTIHSPNEYIKAESLELCRDRYKAIVDKWSIT